RMVFRISCGAFKFMETIQLATIGYIIPNKIKSLHEMALLELEKQDPDLKVIDYFIEEINKLKNPYFPKGGVEEKDLCDNPNCEDGIVGYDPWYKHPISCQICNKNN